MAEHVVDFLQAVEIDRQHRELLVGIGAGLDHLRQRLQERRPVRQIGQAVVIRHMRHPRLGLAAVGDVLMGLDEVLRLAGIVEHRDAPRQEQPQPVLGADRVLFGQHSPFLDRGFIARHDQLGFARIENIRRGQAGGVLAAAIENGFGAAVGEKIFAVADALDDQRNRNVVDDQFEELLGVLQFKRQRLVVGHVVEQRDQEFRLVLVVAGDHAVAGERALFRAALDQHFVAELAVRRIQRGAVGRCDPRRGRRLENLVGALADDLLARQPREFFERAVGEDVAAVLDALGGDADRNIVDDGFQKLRGGRQLPRQPALLAAILMRRHRTAVRQRPVFDGDRSPVGQFGDEAFAGAGDPVELVGADVQHAALAPQRQQFGPGHILANIGARHPVDFEIAVVAEHDALLRHPS